MDQLDTDSIQYRANAAEFVVHNPEFRTAVNDAGVTDEADAERAQEIRRQVFDVLLKSGYHLNQRIGHLRAMGGRSPVRLTALKFLENISIQLHQATQDTVPKPFIHFSAEEKILKTQAKGLYDARRYEEAVVIALDLVRKNPFLEQDISTIGFIMHCYNRLEDAENAYIYAKRCLGFGVILRTDQYVEIAVRSAYNLGRHQGVLDILEQYPFHITHSLTALRAAKSAYKLKCYDKALSFAKTYISYSFRGSAIDIIEIAVAAAVYLRLHEEALRFAKLYLKIREDVGILHIAGFTAQKLGLTDQSAEFFRRAKDLENYIEIDR